jgi:FkbM family methyltransferase
MGFYKELEDFFISIQRNHRPSISIEIGSNEGTFSNRMKEICDKNKIWAFEANPYVYEKFKDLHSDINFLNLAAFNVEGSLNFKLQKGPDYAVGNNSFFERREGIRFKKNGRRYIERITQYEEISVESVIIDRYFENILTSDDVICMWIDVEGSSKQVLEGCVKILQNTHSVFIEVEHEEFWKEQWLVDDVVNFFNENNFSLLARDYQWHEDIPRQENFIFINKKFLIN